jgi:hypothetical protein
MHPQFRITLGPGTFLRVWIHFYIYLIKYVQEWESVLDNITVIEINTGVPFIMSPSMAALSHTKPALTRAFRDDGHSQVHMKGTFGISLWWVKHIYDMQRVVMCSLHKYTFTKHVTGKWCLFSKLLVGLCWNKAVEVIQSAQLMSFHVWVYYTLLQILTV